MGQNMSPESSPNWGTTSHVNTNYEESKLWWTLGAKQILRTSVGVGRRKNIIFYGIKICVVAYITLHPLVHISKYEIYFFWNFWGREKIRKRKMSRMRTEASHLSMIWRVLLSIKYFQIRMIFGDNIFHLIIYVW